MACICLHDVQVRDKRAQTIYRKVAVALLLPVASLYDAGLNRSSNANRAFAYDSRSTAKAHDNDM